MIQLKTHDKSMCRGQHCCVHNPSDHHMRDWPMHWRSDTGVMERTCSHGIGHPDPDDAAHNLRQGRAYMTVHGCDGCCKKPTNAANNATTLPAKKQPAKKQPAKKQPAKKKSSPLLNDAVQLLIDRGPMKAKKLADILGLKNARSLSMQLQWATGRVQFKSGKWEALKA